MGFNSSHWGFGIYESGNTESENKSAIPRWIKILPIGDLKYSIGDLKLLIGDIIPNWVFPSVSPLLVFTTLVMCNHGLISALPLSGRRGAGQRCEMGHTGPATGLVTQGFSLVRGFLPWLEAALWLDTGRWSRSCYSAGGGGMGGREGGGVA